MVQRASLTRYRDIWRTRYTYAFAHLILVPADSGTCQACSETLFRDLDVRESIDILPRVVTDVRARKQRRETAGKIWNEDFNRTTRCTLRQDCPRTGVGGREAQGGITKCEFTSFSIVVMRRLTYLTARGGKPGIVRANKE